VLASLALDPSRPVIACTPMTRQPSGAWPPSFFADVLSQVLVRQQVNIVLFGAANDEPGLRRIAATLPVVARVVAGQLDWLAFACALEKCHALLAMDSGPRHLANAVATPVAFTRNLMFARVEAGAYGDNEIDLAPPDAQYVSPRKVPKIIQSVSVHASAERLLGLIGRGVSVMT
jgi:ADP-heptose:LPS heptosyltransferase